MEEYGLITFKSTQFALAGEKIFENEGILFKTIPTPRDVSHSCGLSLLFALDDLGKAKELINSNKIEIDELYKYTKERHKGKAEKIL